MSEVQAENPHGGSSYLAAISMEGETVGAHVHRWVVDSPNRHESVGRCGCGAARTFTNSFESSEIWKGGRVE